jgi:hypothetical protein
MSDRATIPYAELQRVSLEPGGLPEVQALVERYGGWWNIPQEAWDEHDRRFKAMRARLNLLHKPKD